MSPLRLDEVVIPASVDSADAGDFIEAVTVQNAVEAASLGTDVLSERPAEVLPQWQNQRYEPRRMFVARQGGRIVAMGAHELSDADGSRVAWLTVEVLPEFRGRGIGSALADRLEALAAEDGRTVLQSFALQPADTAGPTLPAPTGFGAVPLDDPATRFLRARGYRLEQVARLSRLALPVEEAVLERYLATALAAAGPDYGVVHWAGPTPEDRLDDLALLRRRMTTDAPTAGLEVDEEPWDADRVRAADALLATSPRTLLTAAVEHRPSGRLVAFNELSVPAEAHRTVEQLDTLVLDEHRGRRLGMLLKAANLVRLQEVAAGHPSVTTFNAEENRHMLDVNEAVGFVAYGYESSWRREL